MKRTSLIEDHRQSCPQCRNGFLCQEMHDLIEQTDTGSVDAQDEQRSSTPLPRAKSLDRRQG